MPAYPDIWAKQLRIRLMLSIFLEPVQYINVAQAGHSSSYLYLDYELLQESDEVSRHIPQENA